MNTFPNIKQRRIRQEQYFFQNYNKINMQRSHFRTQKETQKDDDFSNLSEGPKQLFQSGFGERYWLKNHGKQDFIAFSDNALVELRKYFDSLDQKKCGSIGVEQLQDPFIAFGLSESREQVQALIDSVDEDGSGKIEFVEFLSIMTKIKRGKSNGTKNSAMYDFFQRMISGQLGKEFDKNLTFKMNVSQFRRRQLLESMMSDNKEKKEKGTKILQNFKKQVLANSGLKQVLNEGKKGNVFMYGFDVKKGKSKLK